MEKIITIPAGLEILSYVNDIYIANYRTAQAFISTGIFLAYLCLIPYLARLLKAKTKMGA